MRRWNRTRNAIVVVVSSAIALGAMELVIRATTSYPIPKRGWQSHSLFIYTNDPALADVDGWGFRRTGSTTYDDAEIAAIGDSLTYSYNVPAADAWPAVLTQTSGRKVYSVATGGWAIPHYVAAGMDALDRGVQTLIIGVAFVNDFNFNLCALRALSYWRLAIDHWHPGHGCAEPRGLLLDRFVPAQPDPYDGFTLDDFLKEDTALGYLVEAVVLDRFEEPAYVDKPDLIRVPVGDVEYHFLERGQNFQLKSMTLSARRLEEIRNLFKALANEAKRRKARVGVVFLPTRSRIFARVLPEFDIKVPAALLDVAALEEKAVDALNVVLRDLNIPVVDAIDGLARAFREATKSGTPLWPAHDEHPYAPGYVAIAGTAQELLDALE